MTCFDRPTSVVFSATQEVREVIATRRGSKVGERLADLASGILVRRILQQVHDRMEDAGLVARPPSFWRHSLCACCGRTSRDGGGSRHQLRGRCVGAYLGQGCGGCCAHSRCHCGGPSRDDLLPRPCSSTMRRANPTVSSRCETPVPSGFACISSRETRGLLRWSTKGAPSPCAWSTPTSTLAEWWFQRARRAGSSSPEESSDSACPVSARVWKTSSNCAPRLRIRGCSLTLVHGNASVLLSSSRSLAPVCALCGVPPT